MSQVIHSRPTPQMLTTLMVTPAANVPPPPIMQKCNGGIQVNGQHEENMKHVTTFRSEFKTEPALDIMDTKIESTAQSESDCFALQDNICPKIRLTPTSKLLASPNPVDPKRKFVCPYENCTKSYGKSSHLRSHLTWHTGIKPFVCSEPMCGKGFTRSDELNRHVRTHTGEKPFECVQCTKKFSRSDHLTKHLATHERQMKSPVKRRQTAGSPLNSKMTTRRTVKSSRTGRKPCIGMEEGVHFMAVLDEHPPEQLQMPLGTAQAAKAISVHNQHSDNAGQFSAKEGYPKQTVEFLALPQPVPLPAETTQQSERYAFNHSTSIPLVKNEPVEEVDPLLPQLPPPDGPNTYGMPQFIQNKPPERSTTHDRPYHCRECMKRFKRQDDLNRHIRTHTGEKPYACDKCPRRFMRSDHLRKHQQTHLKSTVKEECVATKV